MEFNTRIFISKNDNVNVWLTKLRTSIKTGMVIPATDDPSVVGYWFEKILQADGFNLNAGAGPDIKELGIELKTRKINAQSPVSIGSLSVKTIKETSWKKSSLYKKCQLVLLLTHDINTHTVVDVNLLDLRDVDIQERLRTAYILGRREIRNEFNLSGNQKRKYIAPSQYAYFEWPNSSRYNGCYEFRISVGMFKTIKSIGSTSIDSTLMEWGKPDIRLKAKKSYKKLKNVTCDFLQYV